MPAQSKARDNSARGRIFAEGMIRTSRSLSCREPPRDELCHVCVVPCRVAASPCQTLSVAGSVVTPLSDRRSGADLGEADMLGFWRAVPLTTGKHDDPARGDPRKPQRSRVLARCCRRDASSEHNRHHGDVDRVHTPSVQDQMDRPVRKNRITVAWHSFQEHEFPHLDTVSCLEPAEIEPRG